MSTWFRLFRFYGNQAKVRLRSKFLQRSRQLEVYRIPENYHWPLGDLYITNWKPGLAVQQINTKHLIVISPFVVCQMFMFKYNTTLKVQWSRIFFCLQAALFLLATALAILNSQTASAKKLIIHSLKTKDKTKDKESDLIENITKTKWFRTKGDQRCPYSWKVDIAAKGKRFPRRIIVAECKTCHILCKPICYHLTIRNKEKKNWETYPIPVGYIYDSNRRGVLNKKIRTCS